MKKLNINCKKAAVIALSLTLVLGSFSMAFAGERTGIVPANNILKASSFGIVTPYSAANTTIDTNRPTSTTGESTINVSFSGLASQASIVATLQEKSGSSWVTASGVSPTTDSKTTYNCASISLWSDWELKSTKAYRIKAVITDKINSATYSKTVYSDSF